MSKKKTNFSEHKRWWREWEVAALIAIVLAVYFRRLTTLPLRGEESRWTMVAVEILWTGDWIVPRQQDQPFLSRPPLGAYPIAWLGWALGEFTPLATRLPAATATLLTTLLIYGYSRRFLSRVGAFAAGLAYASAGQVLQLGQLAETESIFTLLVASSLLVWHWGYVERWHPLVMWSLAYLFVALGMLTKGAQAPVYFAATVGLFLLLQRDYRALLSRWHFAGIGVFAVVFGAWQVPFALRLGWPAVKDIFTGDVGLRFVDTSWGTIVKHLAVFPLELWVCLLPGSLLLLAFLRPAFWKQIAPELKWASFLLIAIGVSFPTCWIVPGAKTRYYMPLYPCFAPLIGLVVDRIRLAAPENWLSQLWRNSLRGVSGLAIGSAFGVLALAAWPELPWPVLRQTWLFAGCFSVLSLACGIVLWRQIPRQDEASLRLSWGSLACFAGLLYTGLLLNITLANSQDIRPSVTAFKQRFPSDARLVSFGYVETTFTLPYGQHVPLLATPKSEQELPDGLEYFAVDVKDGQIPELPFAWEQEAIFTCDRRKRKYPRRQVLIGRRVESIAAQSATTATRR